MISVCISGCPEMKIMPVAAPENSLSPWHKLLFRLLSIPAAGAEISDRIVAFEAESLRRQPVSRASLMEEFRSLESPNAVRVLELMPVNDDGTLDDQAVDRLLVTVHCEMQRLSEEFQHGRRMADLLNPLVETIRAGNSNRPLRVVDIGCGTGFVLRW